MPRQLFFLHTSEKLIKVPPPAQADWLRAVRQYFASTWTDDAAGSFPSAFVFVPHEHRVPKPGGTYGRFQQALFPSVPWMQFQHGSVWGATRLSAPISGEFWRLTKRPHYASRPIDLMFVLLRDPSMPLPLKHPQWVIHGYPGWRGVVAESRPMKPIPTPPRAVAPVLYSAANKATGAVQGAGR